MNLVEINPTILSCNLAKVKRLTSEAKFTVRLGIGVGLDLPQVDCQCFARDKSSERDSRRATQKSGLEKV